MQAQRSSGCSGLDLVQMERCAGGEDEVIGGAVDQFGSGEPSYRVQGVRSADVFVGVVTDKLVYRPRPLIVRVKQAEHDARQLEGDGVSEDDESDTGHKVKACFPVGSDSMVTVIDASLSAPCGAVIP